MQIRAFGVSLIPSPSVNLDDLWKEAAQHSSRQITALEQYLTGQVPDMPAIICGTPIIAIEDYGQNYKAGIIIKVRDAKSIFTVEQDGTSLKVSAQKLRAKQKQTEINVFLLRKDTGKGLYAYYHQSSHMNDFCLLFKRVHEGLITPKRKAVEDHQIAGVITKKERDEQLKALSALKYVIMTRSGDADELIEGLANIKNLKLVFEDWASQTQGDIAPLVGMAKRTVVGLSFSDDANTGAIKDLLKALVNVPKKLKKMRVEGTDPEEIEQVVQLEKNLEDFGRTEYDGFADAIDVDLSDISKSWLSSTVFQWLQHIVELPNNQARFTT